MKKKKKKKKGEKGIYGEREDTCGYGNSELDMVLRQCPTECEPFLLILIFITFEPHNSELIP